MADTLHSKIALGTVQFGLDYGISNVGGQTPKDEVNRILQIALHRGVDVLDTALLYGESEEVLGQQEIRSSFKVVSKFPDVADAHELKHYLQKSLERLQLKSLYGYIAHRSGALVNQANVWEALEGLKSKGLIQKIGYSVYHPSEIESLLNLGYKPDLVQVPFSFLDQRFTEVLQGLHAEAVEVHTRSTFLQGLFFKPVEDLDGFFKPIKSWMHDLENSLPSIPHRAAALLEFCTSRPFINKVVMGVNSSRQFEENLNMLATGLSDRIPDLGSIAGLNQIANPSLWPALK